MMQRLDAKSVCWLVLCTVFGVGTALGIADPLLAQATAAPAIPRQIVPDPSPNADQWDELGDDSETSALVEASDADLVALSDWFQTVRVGYDNGFVIASQEQIDLVAADFPFRMKFNGWGQLRDTILDSKGPNRDLNQLQLKRARLIFSGHAFTPDFSYFIQLDGRSSSGDDFRLLDYMLTYDFGHHVWDLDPGTIGFKTGKYKMPFHLARYLSGREFEFSDRSMASTYFDVNRSLAWGLYGNRCCGSVPVNWELAVFNGLVSGGAETGSSGTLDNNSAYSTRIFSYPTGQWGEAELADFSYHENAATRVGAAFAFSTIEREGTTEFGRIRVVDSGEKLSEVLLDDVLTRNADEYSVSLYSVDASCKYRGLSMTAEYYFRNIGEFRGAVIPDLFDHGFWLQTGYFVIPEKLEFLARWSRVNGNSGTLGEGNQSSDELAAGLVWYFRGQHAKLVTDLTHMDGTPISSSALDMSPGDIGWLFRSQIQFSF